MSHDTEANPNPTPDLGERIQRLHQALRHPKILAADGWYTQEDDRIAPTDREYIAACDPATISALLAELNAEQAQRITLQHHAADLAQRVADLTAERDELRARLAEIEQAEPVAVVGETYSLLWASPGTLSEIARRHGIKVGSLLYTRPTPAAAPELEPTGWTMVPADSVNWRDDDTRGSVINMWHCMLAAAPDHAEDARGMVSERTEPADGCGACGDMQKNIQYLEGLRQGWSTHAADLAQRVAELEAEVTRITECGRAHIRRAACLESERDTARGALRELERQVFALQQQRDVLQTCLDRHQRDAADPPGYLQDAVIRAAGLGALHEQRDAAIKERDELRTSLAEAMQQRRDTQDRLTARQAEIGRLRAELASAEAMHPHKPMTSAEAMAMFPGWRLPDDPPPLGQPVEVAMFAGRITNPDHPGYPGKPWVLLSEALLVIGGRAVFTNEVMQRGHAIAWRERCHHQPNGSDA